MSEQEQVRAPLETTARAIAEPFREFVDAQSASGWILLAATALAIALANSALAEAYFGALHLSFGITFAGSRFEMSLQHWVNDGLMAVFFFLLGLELKREFLAGQLSELRRATSILFAAAGGVVLPATLFLVLAGTPDINSGWGIPIATDTAFAIMVLVLLGDRVPVSARAFLVGLAIIDDLAAILVIAFFYTSQLDASLLVPAMASAAVLLAFNLSGVRRGLPYLVVGAGLWLLFLQIGLHGTLAGIVVALLAPVRPAVTRQTFLSAVQNRLRRFRRVLDEDTTGILEQPEQQGLVEDVLEVAEQATVPLRRWESRLEKPVSFIVMPLFAFANAGVVLSGPGIVAAWTSQLSYAILIGMLVGKPLGIVCGAWVGKRLGLAELPAGLTWRHLAGIGVLGSIGFTMSLFIATLSFGEGTELLEIAKQGIIVTSLCAGLLGYGYLRRLPARS